MSISYNWNHTVCDLCVWLLLLSLLFSRFICVVTCISTSFLSITHNIPLYICLLEPEKLLGESLWVHSGTTVWRNQYWTPRMNRRADASPESSLCSRGIPGSLVTLPAGLAAAVMEPPWLMPVIFIFSHLFAWPPQRHSPSQRTQSSLPGQVALSWLGSQENQNYRMKNSLRQFRLVLTCWDSKTQAHVLCYLGISLTRN